MDFLLAVEIELMEWIYLKNEELFISLVRYKPEYRWKLLE